MTTSPLEAANGRVLKMYLDGMTPPDIARELGVSRQAVHAYLKRHDKTKLRPIHTAAERAVADYWIADKRERLSRLQAIAEKTLAEVDEYGIVVVERVTETTKEGSNETVIVSEKRDYRASLVRELRGIFRDAAEEMGQLPKPGDINIHAGDGSKVLVVSPEPPLGLS